MKTDKNFKLPRKYKVRLGLMKCSSQERGAWKKLFIVATLAEEQYKKAKIVTPKGE